MSSTLRATTSRDLDRDSSSILRASVLDVFRDLGALEDNSVVKAWILDTHGDLASPNSLDPDSLEDMDDEPETPKATRVNFPDEIKGGPANEDDEETRKGRSGFRNAISRPFRMRSKSKGRSKSRPRDEKGVAHPRIPSGSSGYDTDEGYTSSSSATKRRRKLEKKKPASRPVSPREDGPPPVPILDASQTSNALTRFFRAPKHKRKMSDDQSSNARPSISSPITTPTESSSQAYRTMSKDSAPSSRREAQSSVPAPHPHSSFGKRLSFIVPSSTLPPSLRSRRGVNLSLKPQAPAVNPSPYSEPKSAPSSPFLLVAPYGGIDTFVDGASSARTNRSSIPLSLLEDEPVPSGLVPVSISKTERRQTMFFPSQDAKAISSQKSLKRRGSLDSQMDLLSATTPGGGENLMIRRGKDAPFPVQPVRLVAPPRLKNPDASRFGEMDLEEDRQSTVSEKNVELDS
ncbi:hypothetical protein DL96DRAFT_1603763 [Flagelloscypha sp. PMI_526]|nr:hypothetical protein DL96DRAFT_1603763 [Flagelloscypha sp. PMI_526]